MKLLAYIRMVLWSFMGIRRNASAGDDFATVKPLALLGTAAALVALLGLALFALARLAVSTLQ